MSQAIVKLQRKGQMVIPRSLREEAGLAEGTLMKVSVLKGGQFLLTPQVTIDRDVVVRAPGRKDRGRSLQELAQVVSEIRKKAKAKGLDTLSMPEINRAVAAARRDLKKGSRRQAK